MKIAAYFLAFSLAFAAGWQVQGWRKDAILNKIEARNKQKIAEWQTSLKKKAKENADLQQKLFETIASKKEVERQKQKVTTKYVTKEIIKYVKTPDAGMCAFSDRWVRIHDAAALGVPGNQNLTASPGTDDAAEPVTDIEALQVTTENYAICNENAVKLKLLQEWAEKLRNAKF